jgi:hypothetical protein
MKKISVITFGLLLAASPAFADGNHGNGGDQQSATASVSTAQLQQINTGNVVGDSAPGSQTDASNEGVSTVGIINSNGVINQNINSAPASNVGAATGVVISGGVSVNGGNVTVGNANDNGGDQLAVAQLQQINTGNVIGDSAFCSQTSAQNDGINHVAINGSNGVISQQVNSGVTSNVGSAIGISIR